jgi:hypothetical protein
MISNLCSECLTREALGGFEEYKTRGQVIRTAKDADDRVLLSKEETMLQGMPDRLIEIGKCHEMEMNVEKTKLMRNSSQPSALRNMIDQKQPENVEYTRCLVKMITKDIRHTREIEPGLPWQKQRSTRRKFLPLSNWI